MHLVAGGTGYFGEILVRRLLQRGEAVRVFDLNRPEGFSDKVEVQQGDIRDAQAVRRACEDVTHIYHCVAQVPLAKDSELFWSVNRDGTANLLAAAAQARVRKLIYLSSSAVFGIPASNPVSEETLPAPREDYGRAKLEGERLCSKYASKGLDVSIIRPRTILGHGRLGIFQILFEWIHQGQNIPVFDDGGNMYQFVHADDLAEACLRAAARPGAAIYNIGAERFGSMRQTLEGLLAHAGTRSRLRSVPMWLFVPLMHAASALRLSPLAPYHSLMYGRSLYFDITKARRELEWTPCYGNVEMLCESYDWYCRLREMILRSHTGSRHRSAVRQGVMALFKYFF